MLRAATEEASGWLNGADRPPPDGRASAPFLLSVNLSRRQFREPVLVDRIEEILAEAGMPPNALQIEITEGVAVQAAGRVQWLPEMGLTGLSGQEGDC